MKIAAKLDPKRLDPAKLAREKAWIEENRAAFAYWNDWIDKNGIPLSEYRQF